MKIRTLSSLSLYRTFLYLEACPYLKNLSSRLRNYKKTWENKHPHINKNDGWIMFSSSSFFWFSLVKYLIHSLGQCPPRQRQDLRKTSESATSYEWFNGWGDKVLERHPAAWGGRVRRQEGRHCGSLPSGGEGGEMASYRGKDIRLAHQIIGYQGN